MKPILMLLVVGCGLAGCGTAPRSPLSPGPDEEARVNDRPYTLGMWRPKPGREAAFVAAWKELGEVFLGLPSPPGPGILLRSESDPGLFYSFGPWSRLEDIEAMRGDPRARKAIRRVIDLCEEASPGTYRVVARAPDDSGGP